MTHRLTVTLVILLCLVLAAITLTYDGIVSVEKVVGAPSADEAQ